MPGETGDRGADQWLTTTACGRSTSTCDRARRHRLARSHRADPARRQGLLLAENVVTDVPLPGFDNSAMDGYAVRAVDTRGASAEIPTVLPVVGDVAAGAQSRSGMGPGLAMRIMTGAPIPAGADAVIALEETDRGVARVAIAPPVQSGEYVRRAGEDIQAGAPALGAGAALGPQQIALLAAIGRDRVLVRPAPRVIVISTGSELIDVGQSAAFGEVTDSNSYLITAAARDAGADAHRVGIVPTTTRCCSTCSRASCCAPTSSSPPAASAWAPSTWSRRRCPSSARSSSPRSRCSRASRRASATWATACRSSACPATRSARWCRSRSSSARRSASCSASASSSGPPCRPSRSTGRESRRPRQYRRGVLHREATGGYSVSLVGGAGSHLIASMASANCLVVIDEEVTEVVAGLAGHRHPVAAVAPLSGWRPSRLARTAAAGPVALRPPRLRDGRAWSEIRLRNEIWLSSGSHLAADAGPSAMHCRPGRRCARRCARPPAPARCCRS